MCKSLGAKQTQRGRSNLPTGVKKAKAKKQVRFTLPDKAMETRGQPAATRDQNTGFHASRKAEQVPGFAPGSPSASELPSNPGPSGRRLESSLPLCLQLCLC
jgi:hypothetical protein